MNFQRFVNHILITSVKQVQNCFEMALKDFQFNPQLCLDKMALSTMQFHFPGSLSVT